MSTLPASWLSGLLRTLEHEPFVVRIVLAEVRGSAPRECGTSMLVWPAGVMGTIGGGRLEWDAIAAARELLQNHEVSARVCRLILGADLGQCCGGVVTLWIERYGSSNLGELRAMQTAAESGRAVLVSTINTGGTHHRLLCDPDAACAPRLPAPEAAAARLVRVANGELTLRERLDDALPEVWLYGAGHVGQALSRILVELPVRLTWIDSRAEWLPRVGAERMRVRHCSDPVATLDDAPVGACFVVMTHSHALDYALCRTLLERNDFAWLGLIGSMSKAARFRSRLAREGVAAEVIARLACPVGVQGIASKWPSAIAVAIAAQLLQQLGGAGTRAVRRAHEDCDRGCASCGSTQLAHDSTVLTP
ncbi:MAG TPA: xanthine dehydrogenase accessory protein XdhC [Steroidobacteraceae bacterium]|nr:xanthine dehydrogenase accessory protein XdhC [Steroidobacteraceae bacterium]